MTSRPYCNHCAKGNRMKYVGKSVGGGGGKVYECGNCGCRTVHPYKSLSKAQAKRLRELRREK